MLCYSVMLRYVVLPMNLYDARGCLNVCTHIVAHSYLDIQLHMSYIEQQQLTNTYVNTYQIYIRYHCIRTSLVFHGIVPVDMYIRLIQWWIEKQINSYNGAWESVHVSLAM